MSTAFREKIILITGGAGGIGSATARHLASEGATVVLADIDRVKLDAIIASMSAAGHRVRGYAIDVVDKAQVQATVDAVLAEFGRLDVLINSAGVMYIRPITEVDTTEWETTIDLNIKGTLWGIAAALPVFMAQNLGHVINLGSVHGLKVFSPGGAVHSGSKFAIRAISEGLRAELSGQYNIRVTTVTPGAVNSGIQNKTTGSDRERMLEIYKNAIPPRAVAEIIAFAIAQPDSIDLNEIVVRPTTQKI
jgi:NADP-dependent 3-hydroxy acid dehydrogenase YdfG